MCTETHGDTYNAWSWQMAMGLEDAPSWRQPTSPLLPQPQGQGMVPFALMFLPLGITLQAVLPPSKRD